MKFFYTWSIPDVPTTLPPNDWPPSEGILGFWANNHGTVNVLVEADNAGDANVIVHQYFNVNPDELKVARHTSKWMPSSSKYPAPAWSVSMGRWVI